MQVFVYGTLTAPDRVREVLDSFVFVGAATLRGLHAVEGTYPTLAPGGAVAGRLLRTDEIGALDDYERVDDGLYVRVAVPLHGGTDDREVGDSPADDTENTVSETENTARGAESAGDTNDASDATNASDTRATREVAVYVGDPDRLDATADWPGDGPFPERVRRYCRDHAVAVERH